MNRWYISFPHMVCNTLRWFVVRVVVGVCVQLVVMTVRQRIHVYSMLHRRALGRAQEEKGHGHEGGRTLLSLSSIQKSHCLRRRRRACIRCKRGEIEESSWRCTYYFC